MRVFRLLVKAPTAIQMEEKILNDAREFFGPFCTLEVIRDYEVGIYGDGLTGAIVTVAVTSDITGTMAFN
jgi:hypothetical protein